MRKLTVALVASVCLASCSPVGLLGGALGGGPKVAANVQAGKENTQQIVVQQKTAERDIVTEDQTQTVEGPVEVININNESIPPWILIVALIGWLAPSPAEIGRGLFGLFRK